MRASNLVAQNEALNTSFYKRSQQGPLQTSERLCPHGGRSWVGGWAGILTQVRREPRKGESRGRTSSILGDPQTLHFCLGPALLQSETSTAKLNKGKKSQTEQIPI